MNLAVLLRDRKRYDDALASAKELLSVPATGRPPGWVAAQDDVRW